jgi:hypothetical protein
MYLSALNCRQFSASRRRHATVAGVEGHLASGMREGIKRPEGSNAGPDDEMFNGGDRNRVGAVEQPSAGLRASVGP